MARVAGKRKLRRRQGRRLVRACSRALTKASIASAKPAPSATLTLADGYTLTDVSARLTGAITAYFDGLAPGATVVKTRLESLISITAGVVDFTLASPAANVVARVDATHLELATLGGTVWSV